MQSEISFHYRFIQRCADKFNDVKGSLLSGLVQLVEIQGKACCAETDDENK